MYEWQRRQKTKRARCAATGGHYWALIAVDDGAGVIECRNCGRPESIEIDVSICTDPSHWAIKMIYKAFDEAEAKARARVS